MISKAVLFDLDKDKFIWDGAKEKDSKLVPSDEFKKMADALDEMRGNWKI